MPIPQIADHFLAQVVIPSDAPDDEGGFVNTWFFRNDDALATFDIVADNIDTVLTAFYTAAQTTTKSVSQFFSPVVDVAGVTIRIYDLGDAPFARVPEIRAMTFTTPQSSVALPNEVALVLSYNSAPIAANGSTINRRARGRLYLGPFGTGALRSVVGTDGDARVHQELMDTVSQAASEVQDNTSDLTWTQYSRVANDMSPVTQGFVDDRFDTQRRRGFAPTSRNVWVA